MNLSGRVVLLSLLLSLSLACHHKQQSKPSPLVLSQKESPTSPSQAAPSQAVQVERDNLSLTIAETPQALKDCQGLPPICNGGLLKQSASVDEINAYWTKYNLTVPLTCRFMEPPRCYTKQKRTCKQECTP